MVWYSHLFQNFPQFIVIHTVEGFGIVNKAEINVFLELSCFFDDPADVGDLISGSSIFSKTSLLLLLSHFSRVRLCETPETAAHQFPPSLGFSRQEHWSGLPFPSPMRESEVVQSCPTPSDHMDCSLPGSSIHGIFQARVLEWGAIAFS